MKFLGITIYEKLNWKQINHCKTKISSGTYTINSQVYFLPTQQLKTLYYSLLDSYLNYGNCSVVEYIKNIHILTVLQIKSIRKISNSTYNAWAAPLYSKLNILTLDTMYKFELCPEPLLSLYKTNTDIHSHDTRHRNDAQITAKHIDLVSKRFFLHITPEI
jgi:hypothetical protein